MFSLWLGHGTQDRFGEFGVSEVAYRVLFRIIPYNQRFSEENFSNSRRPGAMALARASSCRQPEDKNFCPPAPPCAFRSISSSAGAEVPRFHRQRFAKGRRQGGHSIYFEVDELFNNFQNRSLIDPRVGAAAFSSFLFSLSGG